MEILYQYKKERRNFGAHVTFDTSEAAVLLDVKPQTREQRLHIRRNPVRMEVDAHITYSAHGVNTEIKDYSSRGMLHLEGGWPRDVNPDDMDSKSRFQKKEEKSDEYLTALKRNSDAMAVYLQQNVALDVYEKYFVGRENNIQSIFGRSIADSSATVLTVFKDPCTKFKRAVLDISWFPTDGSKVAIAYSMPHSQHLPESMDNRSCIWDITNPNVPDLFLSPSSPLTCIEYNQKDTPYLLSGASNGGLFVFDTRRGSQPVDYSLLGKGHKDPVYSVKWIQSKSNSECVSISTDGNVLFWDARTLGKPLEQYDLMQKSNSRTGVMYDGILGAISLNYDTSYSTSKFLMGTEQGYVINWNRKTKKIDKVERGYSGHHGPVCAVERNPFMSKYFLSVGDWTARIFSDDLKKPIMETKYHDTYLTRACWSNSQPGVLFTAKMDGSMDVWDILQDHSKPIVSANVSTETLTALQIYNGKYLACGDQAGATYYVEMSDDLSGFIGDEKPSSQDEKQMVMEMFEREYTREKALEARRIELEVMAKQKSKPSVEQIEQQKQQKQLEQLLRANESDDNDDPAIKELTEEFLKQINVSSQGDQ